MNSKVKRIVGVGLFTAIVLVLQFLGGGIRFGVFSISLVLLPIVVGAAVYGWQAGAWLGFVFGVAVLASGDAAAFMVIDPLGTVLTVLVKGTAAGLCSGLAYKFVLQLLNKRTMNRMPVIKSQYGIGECCEEGVFKYISRNNRYLAVVIAAVICPIVNTGVFLIGCKLFFYETIAQWGTAAGFANAASYMFLGLAGTNFLIELATNLFLSPIIVRLISIAKK
ncbi:MAG: ECF transporter S component [Oscillospiraceae bacterium]|nr:ECF transporter S component [Oscillospiraceae bacterium]